MKQNFCENAINTFISINNSNIQGRTELTEKFGVTERTIVQGELRLFVNEK